MPSLSCAILEMRCSFAACAISMSDGIAESPCSLEELAVQLRERASLAVAGIAGRRAAPRHAPCAILEFRDLAERIEHRIGEHVRRRLVESERNEHRAARRACVRAGKQGDLAAPRLERDDVSCLDSQALDFQWV